jgi:DNA-binding MarR family transcriptional regulator
MCRSRGQKDRLLVMVSLLPNGKRLRKQVVKRRVGELRRNQSEEFTSRESDKRG